MPRIPTSFTAGRKVTLQNGTTYQPGAAVPNAVAKACKNLSALLSARILRPNAKMSQTKGKLTKPEPSYLNPKARKGL